MMLRKIITLGALVTAVYPSSTLGNSTYFKSGFLMGAHVGSSHASGSFNSNFDTNLVGARSASGKARKDSAVFGILGGYRHIFQNDITIGVDISGNIYSNSELNKLIALPFINPISFNNNLSRRYSVIPSINFGTIFCGRWHVALGLGIGISGFRYKIISPFPAASNPTTATSTTTRVGFVPSLGAEYAATQNISLIGNISYEIYKKISKDFNCQAIDFPVPGSKFTSSINPRYLTLKIGAVYRF